MVWEGVESCVRVWKGETVLDGVDVGHVYLSGGWVKGGIWEVVGCNGVEGCITQVGRQKGFRVGGVILT